MALKIDFKQLPSYAKVIIAVLPSLLIAVAVIFFLILPKQKKIKELDADIDKQNNEIAINEAKAAKLDVLLKENERLMARLNELKEYLPEEKEISNLLKQVTDLSIASGLEIKSWRPGQKTPHSSGIVFEIPVSVNVAGAYHDFGKFLSSLTRLNRMVNVTNVQIGASAGAKTASILQIQFTASTFSSIPEAEIGKK